MLTNLKDKNIIITGGTSGLGLSVSKHFESKNNVLIIGNKNYSKVKSGIFHPINASDGFYFSVLKITE